MSSAICIIQTPFSEQIAELSGVLKTGTYKNYNPSTFDTEGEFLPEWVKTCGQGTTSARTILVEVEATGSRMRGGQRRIERDEYLTPHDQAIRYRSS